MPEPSWLVIGCCWVVWALYWLAMARGRKRTVERGGLGGFLAYRLIALAVLAFCVAVGALAGLTWQTRFWGASTVTSVVFDLIVLAGLAFTVWARIALGSNWSAEVTLKREHELIQLGPYALVRHPIYTGLLTMALGTAANHGRAGGFALFLAVSGAIWWKARQEERMMERHFPDAYPPYRARVRAIIPFLL